MAENKQPGRSSNPNADLGPALDWDDDDLARMAEITPDDIERAHARVSPEMQAFLSAEPEEEEDQ